MRCLGFFCLFGSSLSLFAKDFSLIESFGVKIWREEKPVLHDYDADFGRKVADQMFQIRLKTRHGFGYAHLGYVLDKLNAWPQGFYDDESCRKTDLNCRTWGSSFARHWHPFIHSKKIPYKAVYLKRNLHGFEIVDLEKVEDAPVGSILVWEKCWRFDSPAGHIAVVTEKGKKAVSDFQHNLSVCSQSQLIGIFIPFKEPKKLETLDEEKEPKEKKPVQPDQSLEASIWLDYDRDLGGQVADLVLASHFKESQGIAYTHVGKALEKAGAWPSGFHDSGNCSKTDLNCHNWSSSFARYWHPFVHSKKIPYKAVYLRKNVNDFEISDMNKIEDAPIGSLLVWEKCGQLGRYSPGYIAVVTKEGKEVVSDFRHDISLCSADDLIGIFFPVKQKKEKEVVLSDSKPFSKPPLSDYNASLGNKVADLVYEDRLQTSYGLCYAHVGRALGNAGAWPWGFHDSQNCDQFDLNCQRWASAFARRWDPNVHPEKIPYRAVYLRRNINGFEISEITQVEDAPVGSILVWEKCNRFSHPAGHIAIVTQKGVESVSDFRHGLDVCDPINLIGIFIPVEK